MSASLLPSNSSALCSNLSKQVVLWPTRVLWPPCFWSPLWTTLKVKSKDSSLGENALGNVFDEGSVTPEIFRSCSAIVLLLSRTMSDIVVLNVGGKRFFTTVDTLTSAKPGEHNYFTFLDYSKGEIFIDRDPAVFNYTLNFLREGRVIIPADMFTRELILDDARFYGLKKFTRMLEWAMGLQGYQVIDVMDPICPRHYLAHDK